MIDTPEIKRIVKDYIEQLYVNKFDNLKEISRSIQAAKTDSWRNRNVNRAITGREIESIVKHFTTKKSLGPSGFTDEFNQGFKEKLIKSS